MFGFQTQVKPGELLSTGKTDDIEKIVEMLKNNEHVLVVKTNSEEPFCDEGLDYQTEFVGHFLDAGDSLVKS